jgi:arylsulfatase
MPRPNILMITVDQWPGNLLGLAGRTDIDTPTLDQIARNGVYFPNAHSECPICIPARRSLMTGAAPRQHGDRIFQPALPRPNLPLLADVFRQSGYQTGAVGKLHVHPARDRIGFEEVVSYEEGRPQLGGPDDWDIWLADRGQAGLGYAHGMSNNSYEFRAWHLDEAAHPTVWQARQMCRMIQRRDPTRPAFWHLSFNFPHPPIVPLADYLSAYQDRDMQTRLTGEWDDDLPYALARVRQSWPALDDASLQRVRRAFHAQCTLIDHQLRLVIGTLREALLLDNTIIAFTSDHGDMLGDHGLYAKRVLLDGSARVPLILMGVAGCERLKPGGTDTRLAGLQDIMPTLLDLAEIERPDSCTGVSLVSDPPRESLYCEAMEGAMAMRMVIDGHWKLIWYPAGNHLHLFDRITDPNETQNLADLPATVDIQARLTETLISQLYGEDLEWVVDSTLIGFDAPELPAPQNRALSGQRGLHYPQPPEDDPSKIVGAP